MDNGRFDSLTKALGSDGSRRRFLKGLLGIGAAAAVGGTTVSDPAEAARRASTPPTPTPVPCPGQQTWNGTACVCPAGLSNCGPDCCNPNGSGANYSECCDGACCFGTCYGEEQCCAYPSFYCAASNACCPSDNTCCEGVGCLDTSQCCIDADCTQYPNSVCDTTTRTCTCAPSTCETLGNVCGAFEDGCGGFIECACTSPQICSNSFCVNSGAICPAGQSYCTDSAQCANEICFCFPGIDGDPYCIAGFQEPFGICGECTSNSDCPPLLGNARSVCVNFDVDCATCSGSGSCALLCERDEPPIQ